MKTRSSERLRTAALLLAAIGAGGCHDEVLSPLPDPHCNPIGFAEASCLLPFPSDAFLRDDPSTASGRRVGLEGAAVPRTDDGVAADPFLLHPADGFSVGTQILALFPQALDASALVGAGDDLQRSLGDDSPTVLYDADRHERVLHFAELDPRATDDTRRALLIRPAVRLREATRYIVAIRGLADPDGNPARAPERFARLRDGVDPGALAERYEAQIFAPLTEAGVARDELLLAWDFTTRTRIDAIGDMLAVRAGVLMHLETTEPALRVTNVAEQPDEHTARRIDLTVEVPLFLDDPAPLSRLHRDADGAVTAHGTVEIPFTVHIPNRVASRPADGEPARLLQYGHGFFGGREEANGFASLLAEERGFVVIAADWWGMAAEDRLALLDVILNDAGQTMVFTNRVHQAMANLIAVADAAAGPLRALPELQIGPQPLYASEPLAYYGISQGHILGATYLALSPHVGRAVLSVGGADFSLMMYRARPFLAFLAVLGLVAPDPLVQQIYTTMAQSSFDRIDPLTYAPLLWQEPLDGSPERQVLMQIGIGDTQVPNLASYLHARALGIPLLSPAPRAVVGLDTVTSPAPGSALVTFEFGVDPLPCLQAIPPLDETPVHEAVRRLEAAKEQLDRFLRPGGRIEHTCDGPCDPE